MTEHRDPPALSPMVSRAYALLKANPNPGEADIAALAKLLEIHSGSTECFADALTEAIATAKALIAHTAAEFAAYARLSGLPRPVYGMLTNFYTKKESAFHDAHKAEILAALAKADGTPPSLHLPPPDLVWWHLHPEEHPHRNIALQEEEVAA